jgi:DNA-binding transcriptional regulator YiaG
MNKAENALSELERLRSFYSDALEPEMAARNMVISGEDSTNLRLWALREKMKLSVAEFAEKTGVSRAEYARYEYRGKKVPEDFLEKTAKKFSVPLEWLKCRTLLYAADKSAKSAKSGGYRR